VAESLDDLIDAVQYAVIEAQRVAEDHHIDLVSRFFETDEETGQLRAITQHVWVPSNAAGADKDDHVQIEVPLISLASLGSMKIKELRVEFDARLSSLDTDEDDSKDPKPASGEKPASPSKKRGQGFKLGQGRNRRRLAMDFKKGADADEGESTKARISITFVGTDPPEGVVRLNDRILKMIP